MPSQSRGRHKRRNIAVTAAVLVIAATVPACSSGASSVTSKTGSGGSKSFTWAANRQSYLEASHEVIGETPLLPAIRLVQVVAATW